MGLGVVGWWSGEEIEGGGETPWFCQCESKSMFDQSQFLRQIDLPYKLRHLASSPPIWFADVFNKPLASCCPTEYLLSCCPSPVTKPCNASVTAPLPHMPHQIPNQDRWIKPFCMKPMNSSACEAGFYFNLLTRQVEPCPDGKIA
ncbi:hypothetical protein OS493_007223 [Desmophyllum pertusum]|uniref:Uncharacterized protein n=1 Tax=Desmophyllum pertusum TaxID=174260 RepID=A0A9X0D050_9CNID|nr:hypothetical protein OS493_007223 [Desmophyllum pertusum]